MLMASPGTTTLKQAALLVEVAGQQRKAILSKAISTIGRSEECDIIIPDFRVSRLHARITTENGEHFIEDAGSRHGTFINGGRVERSALNHKDRITLGVPELSLIFLREATISSTRNVLLTRLAGQSDSSELEQLRLFLEAARTLSSGGIVDDVLRKMVGVALRITRAERGFVYLPDKKGLPMMTCGVDAAGNELARDSGVSHSVVDEAMKSAAEFITGDALRQSELAARQSIVMNELRTLVAIPLRSLRAGAADRTVSGVLYLDSRSVTGNLSAVGNDVLRALAGECAAVLESARLVEAEQAQQQYQKEMAIAASIQRSLISRSEVTCEIGWAKGHSIPCKEIGGDFFDIHVSPEALTAIVVDVSGKGISAALLASVIQGMFYAQISNGVSLVEAVSAVNQFLCSRVAGQKYATLLAAQARKDGSLHMVNCGHVQPILGGKEMASQIEDGDLPVGLIASANFHSIQAPFPSGSRLCILTDGITETEDRNGAEFGLERVKSCILSADPVQQVFQAVEQFSENREPEDDRTLVLLERL